MRVVILTVLALAASAPTAQVPLFIPYGGANALVAPLTERQQEILDLLSAELGVEAVEVVQADASLLSTSAGLELAFPGAAFTLETASSTRRPSDIVSWVGRTDASRRSAGGDVLATLAARNGMVTGSIRRSGYLYEIRPLTGGLHAIARKSMAEYRQHGDGYEAFVASHRERVQTQVGAERLTRAPNGAGPQAQNAMNTQVDVLMPYTTNVTAAYADPEALAQSFIDFSNEVYANSEVDIMLYLTSSTPTKRHTRPAATWGRTSTTSPTAPASTCRVPLTG